MPSTLLGSTRRQHATLNGCAMTQPTGPRSGPLTTSWTRSVRGDVYRLRSARDKAGHEQRGPRYTVALQSDAILLSTLIVAPTSTSAQPAIFRPEIEIDGTRTRVLVDQMRAVDA